MPRGHRWSEQLDIAAQNFNICNTRFLEPVRQSEPFLFEKMAAGYLGQELCNANYLINPAAMFVLVVSFLLRELEVATARLCDVTFNHEDREVRLHLSVSKNDPQALGTWGPWRCVCIDGDPTDAFKICP